MHELKANKASEEVRKYVLLEIAKNTECEIYIIVIDKKDTNHVLQEDFNQYARQKIMEKNSGCDVNISYTPSYHVKGLQATDFVAWAIHRKESYGQDEYYKLIEPKIKTMKKLWNNLYYTMLIAS